MRQFDEAQANRTFWRLKPLIDRDYRNGEWIALDENGIIDHDSDFGQLYDRLKATELAPDNALVVRAGADFPNHGYMFPIDWCSNGAANKHPA